MLAGPPGAGKSTIALVAALKMGVPTLYISADSDEDTMAARMAAAVTKHSVRDVEETLARGLFDEEYGDRLRALPIRFEYDPCDPSIEDIANAITAFVEVWGHPPHLLVVDNLMNMAGDSEAEVANQRKSMSSLHWLARKHKVCVLVLHHTSEQNVEHIESAPPRTAIQNKVSQLPALILTTANQAGEMYVAVVKHRHGEADPLAKNPLRWTVDFARNQIQDESMMGGVLYGSSTSGASEVLSSPPGRRFGH